MRVFFIGTVEFSLRALEKLITLDNVEVVGVATKTDTAVNADFADLQPICKDHNIPVKVVNDINHPNNVSFIRASRPDVIYCFGWSNLIKKELLSLTRLGVVGFHPAAIPANRGRHPIIWALALGLKETASSFFIMDEGADTGDILSQEMVTILEEDDAGTLYQKVVDTALLQLPRFTQQLVDGSYSLISQDPEAGNTWRKRGMADGKIDFRMNSSTLLNLVRALTKPYPGAHVDYGAGQIKVWKARKEICNEQNIEFGKVLDVRNNEIKVKTADGAVWITEHEFTQLPKKGEYL